jgi:hypothetical protein
LSNLFHFVFILVFGIGPTSIGLGYNGSNRSYSSCSSYNSYCLLLCLVWFVRAAELIARRVIAG